MRFIGIALSCVLATALAAQEMIPGTARPLIENMPEATSGYICPMHPNEVKAEAGTCSICGMTLVAGDPMATADYVLRVTTEPRAPKAGQKTRFKFAVMHPLTGAPVADFAEVHDKLFHLFIVSRDMTHFFHEHPVKEADGSFTYEHTLPAAGHYMLFADFMPVGGGPQMIASPLITASFEGDISSSVPALVADKTFTKTANGTIVEFQIDPSKLVAGEEADVPIHFVDEKTGEPVTDLQRYLGAFGHAMMLNDDMTEHVHAHPEEMLEGTSVTAGGGPDLVFHALFPRPGHYRIWLQFLRNDKLSTVPFTVRVLRVGETIAAP
jgi:Heavy metal binding domain